jgi:hypothetical protein
MTSLLMYQFLRLYTALVTFLLCRLLNRLLHPDLFLRLLLPLSIITNVSKLLPNPRGYPKYTLQRACMSLLVSARLSGLSFARTLGGVLVRPVPLSLGFCGHD